MNKTKKNGEAKRIWKSFVNKQRNKPLTVEEAYIVVNTRYEYGIRKLGRFPNDFSPFEPTKDNCPNVFPRKKPQKKTKKSNKTRTQKLDVFIYQN